MTTFRNRPWTQRVQSGGMGDIAEAAFEEWATANKRGFARYGLNRPPIHVHRLPHLIRYTPDYILTPYLVEVQGFGRDQLLKLKDEKLGALLDWSDYHPVKLFGWDSTNERAFMVDVRDMAEAADQGECGQGTFPEGKTYWTFTPELLGGIGELL